MPVHQRLHYGKLNYTTVEMFLILKYSEFLRKLDIGISLPSDESQQNDKIICPKTKERKTKRELKRDSHIEKKLQLKKQKKVKHTHTEQTIQEDKLEKNDTTATAPQSETQNGT